MVAKKDPSLLKHPEFPDIPNLHVMKLMESMKSRGYVSEKFSWRWYYWSLTDEGIEYLREFLHLPSTIVPMTHKKTAESARPIPSGFAGADRPRGPGGDREAYRGKNVGDAPSGYQPQFGGERSGFGSGMRGGRGGFGSSRGGRFAREEQ